MRWLHRMGRDDVLRINEEEIRRGALRWEIRNEDALLHRDGRTISMREIDTVWYRKGDFQLFPPPVRPSIDEHPALAERLLRKMRSEGERMSEYVHRMLEKSARCLGHSRIGGLNKLVVLDVAREAGLDVPRFLASDRRDAFLAMASEGPAVVKAASDGVYLWDFDEASRGYFSYTERLDADAVAALPDRISPSFAQAEIRKRFEVRVFYLDGEMYATAILSQSDSKTQLDYRKYNYERPNRNVPYVLPRDVAERLAAVFAALGLNTGSVDFIVDESGRHVFLEINPAGQYATIARACNHPLDRAIARWLAGEPKEAMAS